jgi:hypothetical protein
LAAALLAACDVGDPISGPSVERPENLGVELAGSTGVTVASSLFWSPDGTEIYFEAGRPAWLRATVVATGATRVVDGPRDDYIDASAAAGGAAVIFSANRANGRRTTYWLAAATGQITVLTNRAPGTDVANPSDGALVLGSPAGERAAYIVYPDSLFLFDAQTGDHRFVMFGCIRAIAFSPDGSRLLCRRDAEGDAGYGVVTLANGGVGDIVLVPAEVALLKLVRWDEDAIRTLYRTTTRFRVRTVEAGNATTIWWPGPGAGFRVLDFINYSWSLDGGRFAFWTHECLRLDRVGNCGYGQSLLHVVDMKSNTGQTVVVAKGTRGGEQVALSPDGRRVAYVFNARIFVQVMP